MQDVSRNERGCFPWLGLITKYKERWLSAVKHKRTVSAENPITYFRYGYKACNVSVFDRNGITYHPPNAKGESSQRDLRYHFNSQRKSPNQFIFHLFYLHETSSLLTAAHNKKVSSKIEKQATQVTRDNSLARPEGSGHRIEHGRILRFVTVTKISYGKTSKSEVNFYL